MHGFAKTLLFLIMLSVVFVVMVVGTISIARAQPDTGALTGFGLERCGQASAPCVRGVTVGQTTFLSVPAVIGSGVRRRSVNEMSLGTANGDVYFIAADEFPDDYTPVRVVLLSPRPNQSIAAVGEFVREYGPPCGVALVTGKHLKLIYPAMEVGVTMSGGYLHAHSTVYSVTMFGGGQASRRNCAQRLAVNWEGFTSMRQYKAQRDAMPSQASTGTH